MNWLYVLEANIYLTLFYGLYKLFLHQETFYSLNRYYLVCSTALAFILPLLQVSMLGNLKHPALNLVEVNLTSEPISAEPTTHSDLITLLLAYGYLSITIVLLLLLLFNLLKLAKLYFKAKKERRGEVIFASIDHQSAPFSFFNLLFIQPDTAKKETIIRHEMVHIRQKHSVDILFFQIVRALNWINPLSWMILNDIKLVHEYIADQATINPDLPKHDYALFLITNSFGPIQSQLSNQIFNPPILKKRIQMLNKQKSPESAKLRLLIAVPLVTGMLCVSSLAFTKDYAVIDLYPQNTASTRQEPVKKNKPATKGAEKPGRTDSKKEFYVLQEYDPNTKTVTILEKRLLVINGKITEKTKVTMIEDIDDIKTYSVPPPPAEPQMPPPPPASPPVPPVPPVPTKPSKKIGMSKPTEKTGNTIALPTNSSKPMIVNNGKVVKETPGQKITVSTFKSAKTYGKNNPEAIKTYGDEARNGVIELTDGKIEVTSY
jgi:hypothetical protein